MARAAPDSRQQARTIAYSLDRALRALAGGLSWERLGRIALLGHALEILPKSLPEASRDLPELTLALLGLLFALLGGFRERLEKDFRRISKQREATETLPTQTAGEGA